MKSLDKNGMLRDMSHLHVSLCELLQGKTSPGRFLDRPEIADVGGLGGPARKTLPRGGVRSAPPFGRVSRAAGAAQTTKTDDFRWVPKPCIKNPSVSCFNDEPSVAQWL
jgi:hypothetical protein